MPKRALHDVLLQLDQELKQKPELDDGDRELLREVRDGLDTLLAQEPGDPDSLRPRLDHAVERFEARHPELASVVSRLIDLLNRMGV